MREVNVNTVLALKMYVGDAAGRWHGHHSGAAKQRLAHLELCKGGAFAPPASQLLGQ